MSDVSSYTVERRHGCRLIFGEVPLRELAQLMMSGSDDERVDPHLSSLTGATMVMGTPEALATLLESADLPIAQSRRDDHDEALRQGYPAAFAQWLHRGERGASSDALASWVTGIPSACTRAFPRDAFDFRRCLTVVETLDAWSDTDVLGRVKVMSQTWAAIVDQWSDLKAALERSESECSEKLNSLLQTTGA